MSYNSRTVHSKGMKLFSLELGLLLQNQSPSLLLSLRADFVFSTVRCIQTLLVEKEEPHFYPYSINFTKLVIYSFIIQDEKTQFNQVILQKAIVSYHPTTPNIIVKMLFQKNLYSKIVFKNSKTSPTNNSAGFLSIRILTILST